MAPPGKRTEISLSEVPASEVQQPHPLLILFLGILSAFLLAAGCLCGGAVWWFRPVIREDADLARRMTDEIITTSLTDLSRPQAYQPKGTIEWNVAFLLNVRGVYYERFAGDGLLMLVEVNSRFRSEEDVRRHIRQTLEEKGGGGAPLQIDESLTKRVTATIRGEQITFSFRMGTSTHTQRKYHLVEGVCDGNSGEVLLAMRVDDDVWNEEEILEIIRSLK